MQFLWALALWCSSALIVASAATEKVLFGQPSQPAEGRSTATEKQEAKSDSPRKARVFAFPTQQDSGRTRTSYVLASPSTSYDQTENSYELPSRQSGLSTALSEESRLLSFLPSFGENGMQVGLDFKLPFFSIPYAKLFSGLAAPIVGGGGGFFGSSYGGSSPSAVGSSSFFGSENGLTSGLATMAAMAVTAALLYPKVTSVFNPVDGKGVFRDGSGGKEDFVQNLNSVLSQFNIDGESCLKVALCSVANARKRSSTQARDSSTTSVADIVDDLLNLPAVKNTLAKVSLVQARDFGGTGGDCDYFNRENKCPVSSKTFKKMLLSFS